MRRFALGGALAFGLVSTSGLAQSTATYTGANNGNWNTPGNWNLGVVPVNGPGETFNAIVPANITVQFDVPGQSILTGLNLQGGSALNISGARQLSISGVSVIGGLVNATGDGTQFSATSSLASLQQNARAFAKAGANIRLGGIGYSCLAHSGEILSASGSGSLLDMSSFASINAAFDGGAGARQEIIRASDGGIIDLSSVTSVAGAVLSGWLRIREETGGKVLLPKVSSMSGRIIVEPANPLFELNSLQSISGAIVSIPAATTIRMPELVSSVAISYQFANGATIEAPKLRIFDGSVIELNPQRVFNVSPFTSIHGASIRLVAGKQFAIAATEYVTGAAVGDMLSASGPGSVFDARSLTSIRTPYTGAGSAADNRILALNGGIIDLSGVRSMQGVQSFGQLRVRAESGGVIHLESLETCNGFIKFEAIGSSMYLSSLRSASSATFTVGVFDSIVMPDLTDAIGCTFGISDGATVEAPRLTNIENSYIELTPSRYLLSPLFERIHGARIIVREGRQFAVSATAYSNAGAPGDTFVADGFGSQLDLSTLKTFSTPRNATGYGEVIVRAANGGEVDLSGLTTITGAISGGLARFDVVAGGTLVFGSPVFSSGRSRVTADGTTSHLRFNSASFRSLSQLNVSLVANLHVRGSFDFDSKDESMIKLGDGKVLMEGVAPSASPQKLEVGCPDLGLPTGALSPSFQIGQLTIGQDGHSTNVLLVDEIDNGNRAVGQRERLYLQGFPAENGLRILGGSSLYIGDLELYAVIGNEWTRIRDLFAPGQSSIAFDGGRIVLGLPLPCDSDLNNDGMVEDADFSIFVVAYNLLDCADPAMPVGCPADLNKDGVVDDADFTVFVVAYDALVCP